VPGQLRTQQAAPPSDKPREQCTQPCPQRPSLAQAVASLPGDVVSEAQLTQPPAAREPRETTNLNASIDVSYSTYHFSNVCTIHVFDFFSDNFGLVVAHRQEFWIKYNQQCVNKVSSFCKNNLTKPISTPIGILKF